MAGERKKLTEVLRRGNILHNCRKTCLRFWCNSDATDICQLEQCEGKQWCHMIRCNRVITIHWYCSINCLSKQYFLIRWTVILMSIKDRTTKQIWKKQNISDWLQASISTANWQHDRAHPIQDSKTNKYFLVGCYIQWDLLYIGTCLGRWDTHMIKRLSTN